MEMFALLYAAAEVALVALGIATMTVVAIGGVVVGSAALLPMLGAHRPPRVTRRRSATAAATA